MKIKVWCLLPAYVALTLLLGGIIFYATSKIGTSIYENGGLKAVVERIWEGKK